VTRLRHIFLARHGETDWNAAGRWQGHTDVPLNATGRAQALALAERLRREGIAAIASSDLARARTTAQIVARALGLELAIVDPGLREQRFGLFEGLTPSECERRHPEEWARYAADPRLGPPGGESRSALLERLLHAVHRVGERLAPPPLVVTHGGAIRALVAGLGVASGPGAGRAPAAIPNAGVLRLSLSAGHPVAAEWIPPATARRGGSRQ
jgi:probable phosphoglycerate mutase